VWFCVIALVLGLGPATVPAQEGRVSEEAVANSAPTADEVIDQLLAARRNFVPVEADFLWVVGSSAPTQKRLPGRLYVQDFTHYRIDYEYQDSDESFAFAVLVPDGRWLYQYMIGPGTVGIKLDTQYFAEKVKDPRPRIGYDGPGTALLQYLQKRGFVTYEGDTEINGDACAVLSYKGGSFRKPAIIPASPDFTVVVDDVTKTYFRRSDGLLVGEETYDLDGKVDSRYRVSNILEKTDWPAGLMTVPEGIYVDLTKQQVRRILYGPPPSAPEFLEALPIPSKAMGQ
jgi:hypothetical protein